MIDLGTITHVCICGNALWNLQVQFEDYEISMYLLDMTCTDCGAKAIAPTTVDRPDGDEGQEHFHG